MATSILRQIQSELAGRLTGAHDAARILADLEQRGLFTYRLGPDDLFRYHGLFRDFLLRKLEEDRPAGEIAALHIHAASFYETHHAWPEAIHHYLRAGLQPQAGRLIALYGEEVASEGRLGLVDEWLQQLPGRTLRENARLSLLLGETLGIRGDWDGALAALARAQRYFSRKGDTRMEALADLKVSTVLANRGRVRQAAKTAAHGLRTAPDDATATRLRLRGNLAITALWVDAPFEEIVQEFRRIVVEAKSRGWGHFAAIGLHNLGSALRRMGHIDESIRSLDTAARFWGVLPASPFADNAELVASLLADGQSGKAEIIASTGTLHTKPWPRPHAEAMHGQAMVLAQQGRLATAAELLYSLLADPHPLGSTANSVAALLVECLYLSSAPHTEIRRVGRLVRFDNSDPRLETLMIAARAIVSHTATCRGQCLTEMQRLREWEARGAKYDAALSLVKLSCLAMEHPADRDWELARDAISVARDAKALRPLKWWLRRLAPHAEMLASSNEVDVVLAMADADPEGWREALVSLVAGTTGDSREVLLRGVERHATRETVAQLAEVPGPDVAALRKSLITRQASRLYVRSFGSLTVHRGTWQGNPLVVDRRRTRILLALLAAHAGTALTRDMVLDFMWPDADPGAAVNSLNQTVFQLRRLLDPDYREGNSPQYIVSTVDIVQLNPALIWTDLQEFRRLRQVVTDSGEQGAAAALVNLVRGQYLADLRYEDWVNRLQTTIHSEVRETLLPIAMGDLPASADLSIRAASALIQLDEFDDYAYAAIARHLAESGRHAAARRVIAQYAKRWEEELQEDPSPLITEMLERLAISSPASNMS